MKNAVVLILAAIIAGSGWWFVKKSEPEIDRRPVSYWLKGLTDGDPQVQNESLQKLQYAEPRHLQEARPRLRYLADHGSALAVSILYQKFHEANDSWLPSFVVLRHSCGLEPLREIARRDPKEVIDQLAEIPHKSEDVLRLLTELEIQVQPAAVEAINRDWAKDLEGKMRDAHAYQRQALEDKGDLTEPAEGH